MENLNVGTIERYSKIQRVWFRSNNDSSGNFSSIRIREVCLSWFNGVWSNTDRLEKG